MIELEESELLGEGRHKKVYQHPSDLGKCIKIMKDAQDTELERELKYHRIMAKRGKHLSMLVEYYGEEETNLGKGYIFEKVVDFDGKPSQELTAIFEDKENTEKLLGCTASELLHSFKDLCFKEMPVVANMDSYNFMIQRLSPTKYTIRVVDNIGTPAHLPLAYYFDFFAKKHIAKYWHRFAVRYNKKYPGFFTDDLLH